MFLIQNIQVNQTLLSAKWWINVLQNLAEAEQLIIRVVYFNIQYEQDL